MMIRNEEKTILKSLNSCKDVTSVIRIFDTGSTDETLSIIETFKGDHPDIDVGVKQGDFVDFAVSRNVLLEFIEESAPDVDFVLLLDSNDELVGGGPLLEYLQEQKDANDDNVTGYLLRQKWFTGNSMDTYFNIRLIKGNRGWRYKSPVHEYITNTITPQSVTLKVENADIMIYQDRTQDCENTFKRFKRDKIILLREHLKNPTDTRTLFYLAQTYGSLGMSKEAYYYYRLRTELRGYDEEVYHAYFKLGEITRTLGSDSTVYMGWFMKALEALHTPRVEPLVELINYYLFTNVNYTLAGMFSNLAIKSAYPSFCNLFINRLHYDYTRYHADGIIQYYLTNIERGKNSCQKAIEYNQKLLENTSKSVQDMIRYKMKFDVDNLKIYDKLTPKMDVKIKSTGKYTLYDYDVYSTTEFNSKLYTFDDKNRFELEYQILIEQHKSHPQNIKYYFYIAQALEKLGRLDDAYYHYKLFICGMQDPILTAKTNFEKESKLLLAQFEKSNKSSVIPLEQSAKKITPKQLELLNDMNKSHQQQLTRMKADVRAKFQQEEFTSIYRMAEIAKLQNMDSSVFIPLYIKSLEVYPEPRIEPLIRLATYYTFEKVKYPLASMFLELALELPYPVKALDSSINRLHYDYTRYHLDGIVQYWLGVDERGMANCQKAIDFNTQLAKQAQFKNSKYLNLINVKLQTDTSNMKFYVDRIKKNQASS